MHKAVLVSNVCGFCLGLATVVFALLPGAAQAGLGRVGPKAQAG